MKFTIPSSLLSARLQTIGRVIVQKNTMPILDSFMFDIQGSRLVVTAGDNETVLTTAIDVSDCDSDIRFAVNARNIQDAIKELPDQPLEFYVNNQTLEITLVYQNGQYRIMGQSADEYPTPAGEEGETTELHIDAQRLLHCVSRTIIATAKNNIREIMNCINFDLGEGALNVVATDGNVLSLSKALGMDEQAGGGFILPQKPAGLLKTVLAKEQGDVCIRFGSRCASFESECYRLQCRLAEGRFPNYRAVIPHDNPNVLTINRAALASTLRRVGVFSSETQFYKLDIAGSNITISCRDLDLALAAEESLLCQYEGNPLSIAFPCQVLLELVNNVESEEITLRMGDRSRAVLIQPAEQKEGEELLMLLMPVILNE